MANDIFDVSMQDRVWKQQFFYNASRALAFNRIDGYHGQSFVVEDKAFLGEAAGLHTA